MPRHLFGELSRTADGCSELTRRNLIFEMVAKARSVYETLQRNVASIFPSTSSSPAASLPAVPLTHLVLQQHAQQTLELRSVLWSLGHMASNEVGVGLLLGVDPHFVSWCVDCVATCSYYNVRGTFFHVLGLVSRSPSGLKKLLRLGWDRATFNSNSAVAIPRETRELFGGGGGPSVDSLNSPAVGSGMKKTTLALSRLSVPSSPVAPFMNNLCVPATVKTLTPFASTSSLSEEQEVLNIILKVSEGDVMGQKD